MKTQYGHNNHGRFDKARNNSQGDKEERTSFFRHPYRRLIMAGLLMMTVLLCTATEQGQTDQENAGKDQAGQTESKEKKAEKPDKPVEGIRPEDIVDSFITAEEAKLIKLVQAYAEATMKDPESARLTIRMYGSSRTIL